MTRRERRNGEKLKESIARAIEALQVVCKYKLCSEQIYIRKYYTISLCTNKMADAFLKFYHIKSNFTLNINLSN
jgi:hypothetical protein